jgi:hypothetical protein
VISVYLQKIAALSISEPEISAGYSVGVDSAAFLAAYSSAAFLAFSSNSFI